MSGGEYTDGSRGRDRLINIGWPALLSKAASTDWLPPALLYNPAARAKGTPMTAATTPQLLRLGHSPDPDDAFMFYGMAKGLIPQGPFRFEHILQDIQTLNTRCRKGELEISAISIHAYPYVADKYALMSCGSSMGDGYGPMVVATRPMELSELKGKTIAIPGVLTTAFLALQLALGKGKPA